MERVSNRAGDRVPAAGTADRPDRKVRVATTAAEASARVKAGAAVTAKDRTDNRTRRT